MTPAKKNVALDDATIDLWRAAENGDFGELVALLPNVADINARNEHGVTALMRAAQQGHVRIVRALLEHGADANIKRNDKFTALALAAFFGHTEVVRMLMEYGADSHAATRYDTSPRMWATARTFNAVAKSLEKTARAQPAPRPVRVAPPVAAAPKESPAPVETPEQRPASTVIRTLSDPPEIWDLVHEVPRDFHARSAFMGRLASVKWTVRLAAAMVLIALSAVGVVLMRRVQARSEQSTRLAASPAVTKTARSNVPSVSTTAVTNNAPVSTEPQSVTAATPVIDVPTLPSTAIENAPTVTHKRSWSANSQHFARGAARVAPDVPQPSVALAEKPDASPRSAAVPPKPASNPPLSPQLIAPAKNSPPKGKVIQWP